VFDCYFPGGPHYRIDLTPGRERLIAGNKQYEFSKGSSFWTAEPEDEPGVGGAFAIATNGPDAREATVNLDSDNYSGRTTCKLMSEK